MPDRAPQYRYRGNVRPCAEVSRPVAAYRNAAATAGDGQQASATGTLDIFDVIDSWGGWWGISANDVDRALQQLGEVTTLYVRVNSPGGEATEGVAIANLLRAHSADVRVTVYGIAASAASVIAMAGNQLSMAPGSTLMIHEASGIEFGTAADLRTEANALDAISDGYAGLYALKGGGTAAEWRERMRETTWYTPDAAVTAKLADRVGLDPALPADLAPVEEDDEDDDATVIEIDVEISPAARAAARRFDLSMLPNAPAALAPKTPAEPPETPPTETEEADTMSDTLIQGLRERFGLPEDADDTAVFAKADELLDQATKPPEAAPPAAKLDAKAVKAALEADGQLVVSKAKYDALEEQAKLGAQARAKQLTDERNELIEAAMSAGKINRSKESRESWEKEFTRDPETAKADLESLPARFPVGALQGHQADPDQASATVMSDAEAEALAALSGTTKEALING